MVRMVFEYNPEYDVAPLVEFLDESLQEEGWEKTKNPNEYVVLDHDIALGTLMGLVMAFGKEDNNFLDGVDKWLIYGLEGCEENVPLDGKKELTSTGSSKQVKK